MKDNESKTSLHRGLKSRHMQMIALGASVGTGLFYGSAPTIQLVGPGVIFSYLLTGIFIFFLMFITYMFTSPTKFRSKCKIHKEKSRCE